MTEQDDFPIENCTTCGEPMIMAITTKANRMPVDPDPVARGNVVLEWRGGPLPLARVLGQPRAGLRVSHFATCKDAAQHRRRGPR